LKSFSHPGPEHAFGEIRKKTVQAEGRATEAAPFGYRKNPGKKPEPCAREECVGEASNEGRPAVREGRIYGTSLNRSGRGVGTDSTLLYHKVGKEKKKQGQGREHFEGSTKEGPGGKRGH